MALKASAATLKRLVSNIEVEHKFNPGPMFASYLANNTLTAPQTQIPQGPFSVLRQPGQLIRDTYYDTEDGLLSKLGLWVRQRYVRILPPDTPQLLSSLQALAPPATSDDEALWNAKSRLGGRYNNSQFVELEGKANVAKEILRITGAKTKLEDLKLVSDLQTRRSIWQVVELMGGKAPPAAMTIVVDDVTEAKASENETDRHLVFNHTVGEIEFAEDVITEDKGDTEHEAHRKEVAAQRKKELMEFIMAHPELFRITPKPIDKLMAYDIWRAAHAQH
ncbi:hypothetical protein GGS26DRAFT_598596 [Hypomontagnella submonticulosa]|nr:hypothetical protein GGS26DRAFT_598596 [Hypomontagnella submonticulosa]